MAISKVTSGGIADGTLSVEDIADDAVTAAKLANSINTDIATGVTGNTTANAALPKAGGAMTGTITGFTSTGIDDNADATAITIDSSENVGIGTGSPATLLHLAGDSTGDGGSITLSNSNAGTSGYNEINFKTIGDADSVLREAASIKCIYVDHAGTNPSGELALSTKNDAGTLTERMRITSDGRGLSQFTAKVWANMTGMNTPSFRDSHNCSSLTDVATGVYTINFANNLANTNYCPSTANAAEAANGEMINTWTQLVGSFKFENSDEGGTKHDSSRLFVTIFGD